MLELFKDSPAYEWMTADAREEGREEARQQLLAAERQAELLRQQALEARQQALEAHQQTLKTLREVLVAFVARSFPHLARLAQKQVRTVEDQERLRNVLLRMCAAQDALEVEILLLDLDDEPKS